MVSKTNELRKLLVSTVKAASGLTRVIYGYTLTAPVLPYAVLELKEISTEYGKTQSELEVNIFASTLADSENYADKIQDALDHGRYKNNAVDIYTYRNTRNLVVEEDKDVYRIRLTAEVDAYNTASVY